MQSVTTQNENKSTIDSNHSVNQSNQSDYFKGVRGQSPVRYTMPSLPKGRVQPLQKLSEGPSYK